MFFVKTLVSALIIAGASEVARRSNFWASILISLPLMSVLTIFWVYFEQKDSTQILELSNGILLAVIPSLLFFIVLSLSIRVGIGVPVSLFVAIASTAIGYFLWIRLLSRWGISI